MPGSNTVRRNRMGDGDDPNQARILNLRVPFSKLLTINDPGAAVGFGFISLPAKIPLGDFLVLGGVAWLRFEESPLSANISDTFALTFSLGTTGTVDNSLATTEVNILAATATSPATATAGVVARGRYAIPASASGGINNNGGGGLFLNATILAADLPGSAVTPTILVSGTIVLAIIPLGKNS